MSWFEGTAIASLAKNAIKEAQKTIDKALDIQGEDQLNQDTKPLPTKEKLKKESDDFFASYGISDSLISPSVSQKSMEDEMSGSLMVGSLWGSFTGSFFDHSKSETKPKELETSTPESPSGTVVATQPPRCGSSLSTSSSRNLKVQESSTSCSILHLSSDEAKSSNQEDSSPSHSSADQSLQLYATSCALQDITSANIVDDWNWDNCEVGGTSSINFEDGFNQDKDSVDNFLDQPEESLVDNAQDTQQFSKARLIVHSVDESDSSSNQRNSGLSGTSCQSESLFFSPGTDDVFTEVPMQPSSFTSKKDEFSVTSVCSEELVSASLFEATDLTDVSSKPPQSLNISVTKPYDPVDPNEDIGESSDSIAVLGSEDATPSTPLTIPTSLSVTSRAPLIFPAENNRSSGCSSEIIPSTETPTTPSSIEVISGKSSAITSPSYCDAHSHTISEYCTALSASKQSSLDSEDKITMPTEELVDKKQITQDKINQNESLTSAIVHQPLPSSTRKNELDETIVSNDELSLEIGYQEEEAEEMKDSILSSTTSSSTLTLVDSTGPSDLLLDVFGSPPKSKVPLLPLSMHPKKLETTSISREKEVIADSVQSMNAGEIRKKLDQVDKEAVSEVKKDTEERTKLVDSSSFTTTTNLDISCRSESSTETVTASLDSQPMTWSDLTSFDYPLEDDKTSSTYPENKETQDADVQEMLQDAIDGVLPADVCNTEVDPAAPSMEYPEMMDQTDADQDQRVISTSSSDISCSNKIISSGQSSADEMETTNSSDIEIISSPSIDGSLNGNSRGPPTLPSAMAAKVWLSAQKGLRSFIHERAEAVTSSFSGATSSGSNSKRGDSNNGCQGETVPSSMTTSFTSVSESEGDNHLLLYSDSLQLEASRITHALFQDICVREKGHKRSKSNYSETSEMSFAESLTPEVEKLIKKLNQLTEILEARETRVLELSQANSSLMDANATLKSRLSDLEGQSTGFDNTEGIREEFTQRLVSMERKFQQSLKDKELMKKQIEEFKAEAASKGSTQELKKELNERDAIITELRAEGEKLSKQQLNYSTLIKKLRAKEKDLESNDKRRSKQIENQSSELERLQKQLESKEEIERNQIDAVRQLTLWKTKHEEDTLCLKAENSELEGKLASLKEALETAYREMGELQKGAATKESEVQKMALSADISTQQKIEIALAEAKQQKEMEQEALLAQIKELQDTLARSESQNNRKERQLKEDIHELQLRLSHSESRNDEISQSLSTATRPLLRQMENIQASQLAQQATWESMEESLTKRLHDAQAASLVSAKKEREAREQLASIITEMSSLQTQIASLQVENAELKSKMEVSTSKITTLEEAKIKDSQQLGALKSSFAEEISDVKRERDVLEQQLDIEKTAVQAEKQKSATCQEQLREKERKLNQLQALLSASQPPSNSCRSSPRSSPTPSLSRLSVAGSVNESFGGSHWGDDVFESSWSGGHRGTGSVYEVLRGNNASTVDALTSALRQREGEVHHMQSELTRLEAQKESLAQELVQVSRDCEGQELLTKDFESTRATLKDLEQKNNALLQMYGEKVEEVEELRLDLVDVKEMYKLQIDQLMQK